jgi:16S rRNA C967 or C1407 C5-methylase (RsmB/RsmF family)
MVYSTCSLNPIENEAVVLTLLEEFGDEAALIDTSPLLPGLRRVSGLTEVGCAFVR